MGNSYRIEREQMNSNYTTQQFGQFMGVVKHSISQNDTCRILKFNSTNSLLFTGSETKIKMHAFHKEQLHKICELYHSNLSLTYLNCKKDTILISGCDKMIIMRTLIGINNKKVLRKIIVNDNNFSCFALSEQNNLLVTGLYKHIYFFGKQIVNGYLNKIQNQLMELIGFTVQALMNLKINQSCVMEIIKQLQFNNQVIKYNNGKQFKYSLLKLSLIFSLILQSNQNPLHTQEIRIFHKLIFCKLAQMKLQKLIDP